MAASRFLSLLLAAGFAATPALAQKKVERRLPLGMEAAFRIVNMVGSVTVHGWNKDTVLVRAALPQLDKLLMGGSYTGAKMFIDNADERDPKPSRVEVWLPSRARLWIKTATANIDVTGSGFRLAAGITNCDRRSAIQQLKHSQSHFMLTVRNRQSRGGKTGNSASVRRFQKRLRDALERWIRKKPVQAIHHYDKR